MKSFKTKTLVLAVAICFTVQTALAEEVAGSTTFEIGTDFERSTYYQMGHKNKVTRKDINPMAGFYGHIHLPVYHHSFDVTGSMHMTHGMTNILFPKQQIATSDIRRQSYDVKAEYGYTFPMLDLTPSIGIGYMGYKDYAHQKNADLHNISNHALYSIVGLSMKIYASEQNYIQPRITYNYVLAASQTISGKTRHTQKYHQNKGRGIEVSTRFAHKAIGGNEFSVTPYFRIINVGSDVDKRQHQQDKVAYKNDNKELGIQMGYSF